MALKTYSELNLKYSESKDNIEYLDITKISYCNMFYISLIVVFFLVSVFGTFYKMILANMIVILKPLACMCCSFYCSS